LTAEVEDQYVCADHHEGPLPPALHVVLLRHAGMVSEVWAERGAASVPSGCRAYAIRPQDSAPPPSRRSPRAGSRPRPYSWRFARSLRVAADAGPPKARPWRSMHEPYSVRGTEWRFARPAGHRATAPYSATARLSGQRQQGWPVAACGEDDVADAWRQGLCCRGASG
jgi:hypothetical protein